MPSLEILHESDQLLYTSQRHRIVYRSPNAADRSMPLELNHPFLGRLVDKLLLQFALLQREGHVHERPDGGLDGARVVAAAPVDGVVENPGLVGVLLLDLREAALLEQVLEDETADVDGEAGRGVVEGGAVGVGLVVEHDGSDGLGLADEIPAHDDDGDPRGPHVLLRPCVDQRELGDVDGLGAEVGGHVGDQDAVPVLGDGVVLELHAVDGLVGADVEESGVGVLREGAGVEGRDRGVLGGLPGPEQVGPAVLGGLLVGLVAPGARHDEVGGVVGPGAQVEGDGGELGRGAALEEEDGVVVGDPKEGAQIGLRLLDHAVELLAAVAHLHDAHARPAVVVQLRLRPQQHGLRQGGGAGGEVEDALRGHAGGSGGRGGRDGGAGDGGPGPDGDGGPGGGAEGIAADDQEGVGRGGGGGGHWWRGGE